MQEVTPMMQHYLHDVMEDDNIFMCEYMTGLPTLAKVKDGDTELAMDVQDLMALYEEVKA